MRSRPSPRWDALECTHDGGRNRRLQEHGPALVRLFGVQPHQQRYFKISNDPFFVEKVHDIVGLYLNPPDHVAVLCVDEKSQIQALDRTQPMLPQWYRIPDSRELAAQYLLLYELSLPYGLDLTNEINLDKSAVRITAVFRESRTADQLALQSRAQQWLSEHAPEAMWHEGASTSMMFAHISRRNIISMLEGTLLGMFVIALIIAAVFRSVGYGLLTLFAIGLPIVVGFGLWGVVKGEVGIGLSIVAGVTLGIVVDYTVHFLSKYRRARYEMNLTAEQGIGYAFGTVGIALLVTTAVLCTNFGILGFSAFAMNAYMGILTAVTIFLALLAQITFMPALLMMLRRPT